VPALPGFLTRNWFLKLSAFGIALLLWFAVQVETHSSRQDTTVPVQVDVQDPGWAILEDPLPLSVTVRFAGPFREIVRLGSDRPSIVIPMNQVTAGDTVVILRPQWVRVQDRPGVTVEDIQPPTVRLRLEPIVRLDLPPRVQVENELPSAWAIAGPPVVMPAELRVSGPESLVTPMDSVRLQVIDLSTITGPGAREVGVDTTSTRRLQILPARATVDLRIEDRGELFVEELEIVFDLDGWEELYELDVEVGSALLTGALSRLDAVDSGALRLVLEFDPEELPTDAGDEVEFPVRLEGVPEYVTGEPGLEHVTVRRREDPVS
jgi:hypothetical protein